MKVASTPFTVTEAGLIPLEGWCVPGTQVSTLTDCSLLIPTYRRQREIGVLLDELDQQPDIPAEVLVIDGEAGSTLGDAMRIWAAHHNPRFDLLYVQAPKGLTRQRNAGIDLATRDYIFFLDDDVHPHAGFFKAMRATLVEYPECGAVGGTIVNEVDRPVSLRWRLRLASGLIPHTTPGKWLPCGTSVPRGLMKLFHGHRRVDIIPGGVSAWRREVFAHHRFSEFFESYSQGEDVEMSLRVGRDWVVYSCGHAHVIHLHAPGGRPPGFAKGRMEVRNRYFIWKRHNAQIALSDKFRFWVDIFFVAGCDIASLIRHPLQSHSLTHFAGVLSGVLSTLTHPPQFTEPTVQRRYELFAPATPFHEGHD